VFCCLIVIMFRDENSSFAVDPAVVGKCLNVPAGEVVPVGGKDYVEKKPDDLTPSKLVFLKQTF